MLSEDAKRMLVVCENPLSSNNGRKVLPYTICRSCDLKKTCRMIQELLSAESEYMKKFKGTILENSMRGIGKAKKELAKFVLEG